MRYKAKEVNIIHKYLLELYPYNEDSFVKIFNKNDNIYKFYNINSLKEKDKLRNILNKYGKNDLLISMNSFRTMKTATEGNLFAINMIAVDIDYKKKSEYAKYTPMEIIDILKLGYFGQVIPEPNYIEYSNQLRLIYILEDTLYLPRNKPAGRNLCNRISKTFANLLCEFGAEVQKAEKFIRIPYSINTKSTTEVNIISLYKEHYKLKNLQTMWLEDLPEWYFRWKEKESKNVNSNYKNKFNIVDFNKNRLEDFEKIQTYLNKNKINDLRKRLCFLYHNYALLVLKANKNNKGVNQKAIDMMLEFNRKFLYPLKANKIKGDTKFLRNKQYIYGNNTLIDFLELDSYLLELLDLKSIYIVKDKKKYQDDYYLVNKEDILNNRKEYYYKNSSKILEQKKEYYLRNKEKILSSYDSDKAKMKYAEKIKNEGKISRAERQKELRKKIKDLLAEGLSTKEIALRLNLSIRSIQRNILSLKKEGLLA